LLMLPMALLVLSIGPGLEMRSFVRLAAAEASRAIVIADGDTSVAVIQISTMAANHGYAVSEVRVGMCGATPAPLSAGGASACPGTLPRGGRIAVRVEMDIPLIVLPLRDGASSASVGGVPVWSVHESFVDQFRSIG